MSVKSLKRPKKPHTGGATAAHALGTRSNRVVTGIVCIFLATIVWIAFGQTIHNQFVSYDDGDYVYNNPIVRSGLTIHGIQWAFTHVHAANWHPLTTISHMLDVELYGLQPGGHHLTNILLHAVATILLFLALLKLSGRDGSPRRPSNSWDPPEKRLYQNTLPCAFVAALFAIHPLRVESVAWVSERKDVLSGVFFMLTLLAYAAYARSEKRSPGKYITVVVLFAMGLMCKPTLVTLPFVLLLLDYWPLGRMQSGKSKAGSATLTTSAFQHFSVSAFRSLFVEKIPLFVLSAGSCLATVLAQKQALEKSLTVAFIERVGNAIVSYVVYLSQMFYPAKLAVLYPYQEGSLRITAVVLSFFLLLAISVVSVLWRKKHPYLLVGWLWYLGMLVPMAGFVQVGMQTRADRYTYLSQIGLYIMAMWGALELFARWRFGHKILVTAATLIIIVLAACTYHETAYWQSSETLWRHAIDNTSDNDIAHYNLGTVLLRKRQPDAAIIEFQKTLQINPDYGDADVDIGSALMLKGQTDQAISFFRKALQIKPDFAVAWSNLGSALLEKGEVDEAIQCYQRALAIEPGFAEIHFNLGRALAGTADWDGAIASYRAALQIQPNDAKVHNNLGAALARVGRTDEALQQLDYALRINPNYPEVHYNLGCLFAYLGRREEAAAELTEALRLKPDYVDAEKQLRALEVPLPR